ncbi:hypothetical protein [Nocardia africana]|uniref:Uncharacterized protein n=1 Tax=Nocardia africana TaxID=134964 RepID=A0A378X068_9NOCA|nr:hypothetical protein [Nocardia africana]MCC3312439.1 hypothetical protein [Nocardia africana]SUA46245.1 Uncharacterised protein [Nocardia africana]
MIDELPRRRPGESGFVRYPTTLPCAALLIRVAQGLDEWSDRDRLESGPEEP